MKAVCDICRNLELILELHDYDYETFPQLKDKKVCDKCRIKMYNDVLKNLENEMINEQNKKNEEMKENGYKYLYSFWIHPNTGDDFPIDIYSGKKLSEKQIKCKINSFKSKYSAHSVEEPNCCKL